MRRIRKYEELAMDTHLHNISEVQRFTGFSYAESKKVYQKAYQKDLDLLGEYIDTPYVRKKTVMKITGITEQDIYEKMRMLEHPHNR